MWYEITLGLSPQYTYFTLLILSLSGPFLLSFDKRVAFYKTWYKLSIPLLIASVFYVIWDVVFTYYGIWKFNPNYLMGHYLFQLPIEEYGFFIVVPYASAFIYSCIGSYFPKINSIDYPTISKLISIILIAISISSIIYKPNHLYTLTTFGFLIIGILYTELKNKEYALRLYVSWAICLIPMSYVNGILTGKPVLIYNNSENLGIRIGTIPFEDFFYHLVYMVILITLLERKSSKGIIKAAN